MKRVLFFANSPDLSASLRFFVNVPAFLVLAAVLLGWAGGGAFESRWTPVALALTHLVTLGVIASAMIGALLQILPVTSGIYVARTRLTATVVHAALTSGTLLLALSFITNQPLVSRAAFVLLSIAFGWFLTAVTIGFWTHRRTRAMGSEPLLRAAQLALLALLVTVTLGVALLSVRAWGMRLAIPNVTDIHGAWGLLGWLGLLLAGVTFKVIPVFQSTELYPRSIMRLLAPAVFTLLALWTALILWLPHNLRWPVTVTGFGLGAVYCLYAGVSLRLILTRKRRTPDTTTRFWLMTMGSFAACLPVWLWLHSSSDPRTAVTLGVLMIMGVAVSAINGMLYKIIPILLWNHTQMPLKTASPLVPKVKEILPDSIAVNQFWIHFSALLLLLLASLWPTLFTHAAALASAVSALWLARNMASAHRIYKQAKTQIAAQLDQSS